MTKNVAVSCIIPTHNRDDYLVEALASVAAQTNPPAEILVVDDVGSERTAGVVEMFRTTVPLTYVNASHLSQKSAGASRNLGASIAGSPYLAFLDDDDLWKPMFLEQCAKSLESEGSALVVTWASFVVSGKQLDGQTIINNLESPQAFSRNPGLTGSNFVISREVFRSLDGFDTGLWVSNDRDFFIRFLDKNHDYSVVPERLVLQRVHQNGQLTNRTARRAEGIQRFKAKYASRISREDTRLLNREIYSILRVSEDRLSRRALYTTRQICSYRPKELLRTVSKKLSGTSTRY